MLQGRLFISKNLNHAWKKKVSKDFYVAMGCYDGEEICELLGFHSQPTRNFSQNFKTSDRKKEKLIVKTFNVDSPSPQNAFWKLNLLDITFDLQNNVYKPYHKANDKLTYINKFKSSTQYPKTVNKIYWKKTGRNITNT